MDGAAEASLARDGVLALDNYKDGVVELAAGGWSVLATPSHLSVKERLAKNPEVCEVVESLAPCPTHTHFVPQANGPCLTFAAGHIELASGGKGAHRSIPPYTFPSYTPQDISHALLHPAARSTARSRSVPPRAFPSSTGLRLRPCRSRQARLRALPDTQTFRPAVRVGDVSHSMHPATRSQSAR